MMDDDTRAAWLAWRRGGIGASEIAAVAGASPWASPLSVYLRKRGELPDDEPPTEAMRLGLALEDLVADEFHLRTGLHVIDRQAWCVHPELTWARCTLDGYAAESPHATRDDALGIVETKTTGDLERFDPLPDYVALQVQWQLFVTGQRNAWVAVLGGGYRLGVRVIEVGRDDAAIEHLERVGAAFWQAVEAGEPPAASALDGADLAAAYANPEPDSSIDLGDEGAALVAELRTLKEAADVAKRRLVRMENAVKALLGNAEVGLVDGAPAVTWRAVDSTRVDTAALKAGDPDLAAKYLTTSSTRRFLVK